MLIHKPNKYLYSFLLYILLLIVLAACTESNDLIRVDDSLINIENASLPNLFGDEQGNVLLSYVTQENDSNSLWLSTWQQDKWSAPELVAQGDNWFINWADFPSVVSNGTHLYAHWLEMNGTGTYAYGVRYSTKMKNSQWQKPQWLHTDDSATEHGFVSLQPDQDSAHAIWLDGRNMTSGHGHDEHAESQGGGDVQGMTLRYGLINESGQVTQREELDSLTCDCCQTTATMSQEGLVIAYRDREVRGPKSEIRDIKVLRKNNNGWVTSENLPIDNWDIQACPVNGPVLAAQENQLALAWFTAANNQPKVKVAFSNNNGEAFLDRIEIDLNKNYGRVGADWLDADTLVVSWLGAHKGESNLLYRLVKKNGSMSPIQRVAVLEMARSSGVPQVSTLDNGQIMFVWTQSGEIPNIKTRIITP